MDIRERIKSIIDKDPDLSVRSVSLKAGLSDSMLHKFLKGSTNSPTLETVDKLAEALGVDARWLAYGEGEPDMATEVTSMWGRMSKGQQTQALLILETFTKTGTDG